MERECLVHSVILISLLLFQKLRCVPHGILPAFEDPTKASLLYQGIRLLNSQLSARHSAIPLATNGCGSYLAMNRARFQ